MRFSTTLVIYGAAFVTAKDCRKRKDGLIGGECVKFYSAKGCSNLYELHSYRPTCEGNCYQYDSFVAVNVAGDGASGTSCEMYRDYNCQDPAGSTGLEVGSFNPQEGEYTTCTSVQDSVGKWKSMKCYFNC
ncbi:hypothetical protein F4779DRAFT_595574 [Xylariaceae sp. FL0662B]|nr:hypothetical protein F4779DRAFT_595574 [Xylariaceae sp. FL0662B]